MLQVVHMDCLAGLRMLPDNFADSIVTDPPYELTASKRTVPAPHVEGSPFSRHRVGVNGDTKPVGGFMGKEWDGTGIAFSVELWREVLRVLKPGGHLLAFSGSRTYHRMACAIEDAGFEIRDQIMWLYGSGFPKSRNISGDMTESDAEKWKGWGTALKPAHEPITVARKPLEGTVAANVLAHGVGGLNIDGCRVPTNGEAVPFFVTSGGQKFDITQHAQSVKQAGTSDAGRWPANLIHDGSDEVLGAFPQAPGQLADASSSEGRKTQNTYGAMRRGRGDEPSANSENVGGVGFKMKPGARRSDEGSAARFFYCAKASKKDRDEGLDGFALGNNMRVNGPRESEEAKHATLRANTHPTVKPTDLMRYLCRLVTPPGGLVLDPFTGSGSTGKAAALEGFKFLGFEREAEYVAIARARIAKGAT